MKMGASVGRKNEGEKEWSKKNYLVYFLQLTIVEQDPLSHPDKYI